MQYLMINYRKNRESRFDVGIIEFNDSNIEKILCKSTLKKTKTV